MPDQKKYIVSAFLILSILFIGAYFILTFFSTKNYSGCGVDDSDYMISVDTSKGYSDGKALFISQCASCHIVGRETTGPDLINVLNKEPWLNKRNLYQFINDPEDFFKRNKYIRELKLKYNGISHPNYDLSEKDIDAIFYYIDRYASKVGIPIQ